MNGLAGSGMNTRRGTLRSALRAAKKPVRLARYLIGYNQHLKNGMSILLKRQQNKPPPPYIFRNGFTWHHGVRDVPDELFREIFIERVYDPLDAPPGARVLDIGANIGAVMLFWAAGRPDICFHAYEPNPEAFATLCKNVKVNGLAHQVKAYREAVGGTYGALDLWVDVPTTLSTAFGSAPVEGARRISVPMVPLDETWNRIDRSPIWMLKIDTEGAEGDILERASEEMLCNVQNACVEWHDNIVPGVYERCLRRLTTVGFQLRTRRHPWDEGIFFASRPSASSLGVDRSGADTRSGGCSRRT
jgi:FkbM family methyltransferase